MKFAIVTLLGLFAIASANIEIDLFEGISEVQLIDFSDFESSTQTFGLPDQADEAIENAVNEYNNVLQQFNDETSISRNQANQLAGDFKERAKAAIKEAGEKIKELVKQGGRVGKCAIKYNNDLAELSHGVIDGLKVCSDDIVNSVKSLTSAVLGYSQEFIKNVKTLKDLAMKCYNTESKIGLTKCIVTNVTEFTKIITHLLTKTKSEVTEIRDKGLALINAAKSCNENHIQTTITKSKTIKANINACLKM